jgi:hypothetical protein
VGTRYAVNHWPLTCTLSLFHLLFSCPDDESSMRATGSPIPVFYRVREVTLVNNRFLKCSCGYPAQMRRPCRHIFAVLKKNHHQLYSVRWLLLFQHCYQREGHEKITAHFQGMIKAEAERVTGEDILVENLFEVSPPGTVFPILHDLTSEEDYELAIRIRHWTQEGTPPIRGSKVLPYPAEDDDDIPGQGGNDSDSDHDMDIVATMSPAAQNILGQDVLATQQSQVHDVRVLTQSSDHQYQVLNGMVQSFVKLLNNDDISNVRYQACVDALAKVTLDTVVAMKQEAVAGKAAATASKDVNESTHCTSEEVDFSETGTYTSSKITRKKGAY